MNNTLTLTQEHYDQLKNHLIREDGLERVAYILCGRSFLENNIWDEEHEERFLSREIITVPDEELIESEKYKVTWDTNSFLAVLKKAESKNFAIAVVHNHPTGVNHFSSVDDEHEPALFKLAFNRNGGTRAHLSLIITPDGNLIGRAWDCNLRSTDLSFIRILGDNYKFLYPHQKKFHTHEAFHRQQLAFGKTLIQDLSKLKVGIVGCGATGSATAMLLARLGIGHILLIDKDVVEITNLNRLHGAKSKDIDKPKVKVIALEIEEMGLETKVVPIQDWVSSNEAKNALKSCDVIFGCTDDNSGRLLINRLAYFYLIPVIDMGLAIIVSNEEPPSIRNLNGRVTVLFPGCSCLLCNGVINATQANAESLKRNDPDGYERLKAEAYVLGEQNPSPAVITFTTEIATVAVNEFIHRIQGYRSTGAVNHRLRFFHMDMDLKPLNKSRIECKICSNTSYWGRGDMEPFLDMV
ncbi:MAG: ThiF family adenylyltransferase [Bacteroidia bacterium]|nr:ThiF family adenylyltransferase [Bacteroidia bacterium]